MIYLYTGGDNNYVHGLGTQNIPIRVANKYIRLFQKNRKLSYFIIEDRLWVGFLKLFKS